jgi:Mrp family chromosome partitioning ATPase
MRDAASSKFAQVGDAPEKAIRLSEDGVVTMPITPLEFKVVSRIVARQNEHSFPVRAIAPVFSFIKSRMSGTSSQVIHITSTMPGEGTSTVARELAFCAGNAQECKVLIVDANPSQNGQAAHFGIPSLPDITNVAIGGHTIDGVCVQDGDREFYMSAYPLWDANLASVNDLMLLRQLYDQLRSMFHLIIVDCPPIMISPDAARLSGCADGVILVIEAEHTRVPVISRAKDKIEDAGGSIYGVVMNKRRHYIPAAIYRLL